ncbi:MAG: PD-(D/E)XK nuclease family protein [DPANN group archaeon]|nr:PD-(D/E)XK nuclease family protein [DPANN group archaeon]
MTLYSHSRLNCFEQCSLKFKFKYIDKKQTDRNDSVEAFLGKRVHETLEKLYKDLKFNKTNSLQDLIKYYTTEWDKSWSKKVTIVKQDYTVENYKSMGIKFITDYYNKHKPFNSTKTLSLEKKVIIHLDDKDKYVLQGFIDRLALKGEDTIEIHDYKTNSSLPEQDYLDQDRQLALYAIGIKKMYPFVKKIDLVWHFLAFDKEMRSSRTEKELDNLKNDIIKIIDTIETNHKYEPTESALCSWCEYEHECPRKKHLFITEDKPQKTFKKKDEGIILVDKYTELKDKKDEIEVELEKIKTELFDYSKQYNVDNIYSKNFVARLRTYINQRFPGKNDVTQEYVKTILKKSKLLDKFITLDTFALTKSMNTDEIDEATKKKLLKFSKESETKMIYIGKI